MEKNEDGSSPSNKGSQQSSKSVLSMQSFASAANFKAEANQGSNINGYIKKHPLTEHMTNQSWNNIPIPTREMF